MTLIADWAPVSAAAGHRAVLRRMTRWVDRVLRLAGVDGEPVPEASVGG